MKRHLANMMKQTLYTLVLLFSFAVLLPAQDGDSMASETLTVDEIASHYKIRPGDTVRISVFNEPDLVVNQKLDPDGVIIIPLLGRTKISDMTLRQVESFVEKRFIDEQFLITPQVTASMVAFAEQVFYIFGEVRNPGAKTFPTNKNSLDILEAITMAGDVSQYAKRSEIIIRRPVAEEDREEKLVVDLDKLIKGSRRGNDEIINVYPNDIIFVPQRLF